MFSKRFNLTPTMYNHTYPAQSPIVYRDCTCILSTEYFLDDRLYRPSNIDITNNFDTGIEYMFIDNLQEELYYESIREETAFCVLKRNVWFPLETGPHQFYPYGSVRKILLKGLVVTGNIDVILKDYKLIEKCDY
jgi:hypothetical protein